MFSMNKILRALQRHLEATARARTNAMLLGMERERLEEWGFSYTALRQGVDAWPWRSLPQDGAEPSVKVETNSKRLTLLERQTDLSAPDRKSIECDNLTGSNGRDAA
jgi:hypothetical protein